MTTLDTLGAALTITLSVVLAFLMRFYGVRQKLWPTAQPWQRHLLLGFLPGCLTGAVGWGLAHSLITIYAVYTCERNNHCDNAPKVIQQAVAEQQHREQQHRAQNQGNPRDGAPAAPCCPCRDGGP